ncbi:MAG: cytochrome c [Myxococcota bacterium]
MRWLVAVALLVGCSKQTCEDITEPATETSTDTSTSDEPAGDVARGRALLERFECSRCHEGTGATPTREKQCVGCHRDVLHGEIEAPPDDLARWQSHLRSLPVAPDLGGAGRFRREWLVSFLLQPVDLRPHLAATMPRLSLSQEDAEDLSAYLTRNAPPRGAPSTGNAERGATLFATLPCGSCHLRGGESHGELLDGDARTLAPDLAFVDRMRPDLLVQWLQDPASLHETTRMPSHGLSAQDASDLAAFLLQPVALPPTELPPRLPILEREVRWEEVETRVFRGVCWHCHSDPDLALGDGGPGNTGGFGYPGRRVDLATHAGVMSGGLDDSGERASLFRNVELEGETLPLVVAVLRARQLEEAGRAPTITGMPLGLPAEPPEDIQLLETWIAQGRHR